MKLALAAAFLLSASVACAQETQPEPELDCMEPLSQNDMTACAGLDWEQADAELNEVWLDLVSNAQLQDIELKNLGEDGRPGHEETLRKAQRAWIELRDAGCEYEGFQARGGSMEPMLVNQCLARVTRERTGQLRKLLQDMGTQ
jgi:uncharacterized protein YecT (DUF1311 family)